MFPKWVLARDIIIILLLCFEATCAATYPNTSTNATKFAGIVKNITVYALRDDGYANNHDTLKSLKLNISWIPPKEGNEPSSYSVIVTSISREGDVNEECTEGSMLYTVSNTGPFSLLVPENKTLNSLPEVQIHPNCTYRIQVHANPRAKPVGKLPEVIYTVPECVGRKCSCAAAKLKLPVPKVEVTQADESTIINWNVTSNGSYVHSYVISIGVPLLISNAGHTVYNITRITNVTSTTNMFVWDSKIDNQYVDIKTGYKIFVAAVDHRGCSGTQSGVTIIVNEPTTSYGSVTYFLLIGVAVCVILGLVGVMSVRKKNGRLVWQSYFPLRQQNMPESTFKLNQWPHLGHQKFNIDLYKEQKSEEVNCGKIETDKFEVSYKCINLMHELGRGQFGTVYLGTLSNNEDVLIAVKMSRCQDVYNELEARHQLLEEIKMMKTAGSHPNLVSFIGYCTLPDTPVCILLEYMEKGDLLAYLHSRRNIESDNVLLCTFERIASRYANISKDKNKSKNLYSAMEKQQFLQFALDIARGMEHLEAAGITHRDLAARNILLTSDLTLKISDFGLSRNGVYVINNNISKARRLPLRWMSPEAVRDYAFSSKSDVWSFGVVLWEIGTLGSFPYAAIPDDELMQYLIQDKCRLACPDTVSPDIYEIMCSCWDTVPQNRPTFAQLVLDLQTLKEPIHPVLEQSMHNPCYTLSIY